MRLSSEEEEEQDVTAKLDPDLEGGSEGGRREGSQPTSSGYEIQSWPPLSAQPAQEAEKEEGWGRGKKEGRGMKGKWRKEKYPIATNVGEIAQIECFAHHDT